MTVRENARCFNFRLLRKRTTMTFLVSLVITIFLLSKIFPYALIDFGYLVRPLWDKERFSWDNVIVHYYAEGLTMQDRCHAHGWTYTPQAGAGGAIDNGSDAMMGPTRKGKVYDAVIFSVELDMLEIRMRELYDVVDHFVIIESTRTFTGNPKSAVFQENRERYAFAEDKIIYKLVPLRELMPGEAPWVNEGAMRDEMTSLLRSTTTGIKEGDYVIFGDVDEIPSRQSVELLSSCDGVPPKVHISLQNYLYSFEFPVDDGGNSAPSIQRWPKDGLWYTRQQASSFLLANAGWHCSFCFRYIKDFQFKMKAYSHADRLRYKYMMEETYLQDAICNGADLFGMFPEAYTYKNLIHRLGPIPKTFNAVGLPAWVIKSSDRFRFLLPGGCKREGPANL
ncbi:glycosyltransferase family 17-domain-containing protein [Linnemannia elongata]|nr:glycosyltransferase family 17-domain-containing protein [Linnemannia elongata]